MVLRQRSLPLSDSADGFLTIWANIWQGCEQVVHRSGQAGNAQIGSDLSQRHEDKSTYGETGMRQGEPL